MIARWTQADVRAHLARLDLFGDQGGHERAVRVHERHTLVAHRRGHLATHPVEHLEDLLLRLVLADDALEQVERELAQDAVGVDGLLVALVVVVLDGGLVVSLLLGHLGQALGVAHADHGADLRVVDVADDHGEEDGRVRVHHHFAHLLRLAGERAQVGVDVLDDKRLRLLVAKHGANAEHHLSALGAVADVAHVQVEELVGQRRLAHLHAQTQAHAAAHQRRILRLFDTTMNMLM